MLRSGVPLNYPALLQARGAACRRIGTGQVGTAPKMMLLHAFAPKVAILGGKLMILEYLS